MRKRARERERKREWEIVRVSPWRGVRKDYNQSNLVKKKKVLSRRLCIIALFSRLSERLSFLPHADYFCIEIVLFHLLLFSYYFLLYFPFFRLLRKITIILRSTQEKPPLRSFSSNSTFLDSSSLHLMKLIY